MNYFAGLDVSLEWTSVCVVDVDGGIVREAKVASEPAALAAFFTGLDFGVTRICLEAGPLSQWLHDGLAEAGLPVVCAETRQLKAVLSATVNKSDRDDARGIAQLVRANLIRPVHVKTVSSQEKRMLLANRRFMLKQLCDAEANIRGTLRNFGLKMGKVTRRGLETRVLGLVAERPALGGPGEADAAGASGVAGGIRPAAQDDAGGGTRRPGLPSSDDGPRRGSGDGAHLPGERRRAIAFCALALGGRALRACASQMAIRRGRPNGKNLQVRRRDDARGALRSRQRLARAYDAVVMAESLGHGCGEASRQGAREGSARPPAWRHHAPHMDGWQRVPLETRRRG